MAELRWGAATDPGRIRPENEDNVLAAPGVFAVADGMGGHRAGEVASAIAVDLLRARLGEPGAGLDDVVGAIAEANGDIYRSAQSNPEQQGMGTTITALVVIAEGAEPTPAEPAPAEPPSAGAGDGPTDRREQLALVNVGDSRTYLLRHDRLRRITVDHSYVQELVTTGHITDDEARTHPRRNIVTRALGIDPAVRVDAWTLPLVRGDRFVLCSDGLVDEVHDDEIVEVVRTVTDPQAAADELVAVANRQGGRDNITVVVVDVVDGDDPPDPDSELDLEPAWDDGGSASTWAVDDPDGEATEFADLAALVGGDGEAGDGTPIATRRTTDEVPITAPAAAQRRRRRVAGFVGGLAVLAVLVLTIVVLGAYARRNYFVAFADGGDVVIYRGRQDGFLWFDPTVRAPTVFTRDELDDASIARVERQPNFSSLDSAENFVADQLQATTTTTTTTTAPTTTTTAPTTTTTTAP